jgi:uncharacterized protein (DUF302 family)
MRAAAAAGVEYAQKNFGVTLDYSETSIHRVEDILAKIHAGAPKSLFGRLTSTAPAPKERERLAMMLGAYLAEVIKRLAGGHWKMESTAFPGQQVLTFETEGGELWPHIKAGKRMTNGSGDNVWDYYQVLREKFWGKADAAPSASPASVVTEKFITIPSRHDVPTTIDRLAKLAESKELRIFARIDHGKGAAEVSLPLRPTQLLLFGHPKGGTPLMQDKQTAGLDLPLRALAWEDAEGMVWLSYYTGSLIAKQHGLGDASKAAVEAIDKGMTLLCGLAAGDGAIP